MTAPQGIIFFVLTLTFSIQLFAAEEHKSALETLRDETAESLRAKGQEELATILSGGITEDEHGIWLGSLRYHRHFRETPYFKLFNEPEVASNPILTCANKYHIASR